MKLLASFEGLVPSLMVAASDWGWCIKGFVNQAMIVAINDKTMLVDLYCIHCC